LRYLNQTLTAKKDKKEKLKQKERTIKKDESRYKNFIVSLKFQFFSSSAQVQVQFQVQLLLLEYYI